MVRITPQMIKKKAEHHDGLLADMEELTLHQLNIEKIEVLGRVCCRLQILYLQNNLIGKIENLKRMKALKYINFALNNIIKIEGLGSCEKLEKLDFTVNFIDIDFFQKSIENLRRNRELRDLYLTGNPCTSFEGWRSFIIATLPQLTRIDGTDVSRSERIIAKQDYNEIVARLKVAAEQMREEKGIEYDPDEDLDDEEDNDGDIPLIDSDSEEDENERLPWTPESRLDEYHKEVARDKKKAEQDAKKENKFAKPEDSWKAAQKKLNTRVTEVVDGKLPTQRNIGRYSVDTKEEIDRIVVTVGVPRFLDTSMLDVDIHPKWFQATIKENLLLMHTSCEINPDRCKVQRNPHNGNLILIMPMADYVLTDKRRLSKKKERRRSAKETSDFKFESR